MKKLAAFLNDYVLECDWKDMALIKTCVCAFGVMLGLTVKKEGKTLTIAKRINKSKK